MMPPNFWTQIENEAITKARDIWRPLNDENCFNDWYQTITIEQELYNDDYHFQGFDSFEAGYYAGLIPEGAYTPQNAPRYNFNRTKFTRIDFSHSTLHNFHFFECEFYCCNFDLTYISLCEFINCQTFGSSFEKAFIEDSTFKNLKTSCHYIPIFNLTAFSNVMFKETLFVVDEFTNSQFLNETIIDKVGFIHDSANITDINYHPKEYLTFKNIAAAYIRGGQPQNSRDYIYLEQKYYTKHNSFGFEKRVRQLLELLTGYSLKIERPLLWVIAILTCFTIIYILHGLDLRQAISISCGSFYTFGNITSLNSLENVSFFISIEAILGCILNGLFIVTLANYFNYRRE